MDQNGHNDEAETVSCGNGNCKSKIVPGDDHGGDESSGTKRRKKRKTQQKTMKRRELMSYCELPEYMKDNEYILNYYRADWSIRDAFFSVFSFHNESLNVWTHLIGFIFFVALTVANIIHHDGFFPVDAKSPGNVTRWPFFVFLGGSMFCLLASSICHLFCCHSKELNVFLLRIDYAGITAMIITSFFPPIFYIFQCTPRWYFIYLAGITSMGIFTIITLFTPSLSAPKYRAFRALLFASMGLFGIVPAAHALVVNWGNPQRNVTLVYELLMAVFYLVGTGFYVGRVPERLKPGWFDRVGHSHQIFHVFVLLGALSHYAAALLFLDWRDHVGC
ncbi:Heptahelical transmembrane protein 1 [Arabidopsis thaliana]|jgi:adiponectin receptor|uniref:Heptahelical transmembrane protein 1 n=4 Tax=Arabidopsis TaxID=3701 RepID=HHP1_ARATH|nr:heptahelical transmembrane protein1 [Arabidopsis thaliana]Q93ZH9.1 RecName: Full=Heptahelical transmembrane protein 1; AltName: Full=PAQR family protein HHP1 [Arabidopsis thaliana]KAG7602913.1 AdipoR/hemolysin-III-related [Arabidopsis thaliana x Arabidopsis arenosa]KAG7609865.1 AdipoR/hemolysin-III-related [Arabidopsis suecica]AAL09764.1 AT5g20270/F5O24_160 [Arabidopsis thaliana]AAM64444.1 unknown [Arabidopsis thaliana]AAN28914.1 At5g20270/F5O24_160 [Arabidopsis thaliana]|eukprot:NP_197527.1 heptahelical transmembrane protein1 [Arabidopsis thaliana]